MRGQIANVVQVTVLATFRDRTAANRPYGSRVRFALLGQGLQTSWVNRDKFDGQFTHFSVPLLGGPISDLVSRRSHSGLTSHSKYQGASTERRVRARYLVGRIGIAPLKFGRCYRLHRAA